MKAETSISRRLARRILTITFIVFLAAIVVVAIFSVSAITKEVKSTITKSVDNAILDIEKSLTEVETVVETMGERVLLFKDNRDDVYSIIEGTAKGSELITSCAIAFEPFKGYSASYHCMPFSYWDDASKSYFIKEIGSSDYDYLNLDWYQIPRLLGKSYWSEPSFDSEGSGKMVTSYSKPLYDENGLLFGVMKADVDLEWLTEKIGKLKPYESSRTVLIGRNGAFISHFQKEKILKETIFSVAEEQKLPSLKRIGMRMLAGEKDFLPVSRGIKGFYAAFGPFQNGWSALLVCSFKDVYRSLNSIIIFLALVVVLGLIALYLASHKAIKRITAPVTEFTYTAVNMSKGFFDASIPEVDTNDEIKRLHDSLYFLQRSIKRYITELKSTTASNERFESELNIARQIQLNMVSTAFPESDEFDLFATLSPAKEVGGDLYDFFVKDRTLNIAIGDVSGKGVPAALYMAILRYAYRFMAGLDFSIDKVLYNLNQTISEGNTNGMFATMFIARINLDTMEMEYCNGGHNPIITISSEGKAEFLKAESNLAIGVFPDFTYKAEKMQLSKGSRLILYTDGISEAEARDYSQYGEDRILDFAAGIPSHSDSRTVTESLLDSVRKFTGGNEQNDDITILTLKL